MTLPREAWPGLKEKFEGARALALDARSAYLAEVCDGDEACATRWRQRQHPSCRSGSDSEPNPDNANSSS